MRYILKSISRTRRMSVNYSYLPKNIVLYNFMWTRAVSKYPIPIPSSSTNQTAWTWPFIKIFLTLRRYRTDLCKVRQMMAAGWAMCDLIQSKKKTTLKLSNHHHHHHHYHCPPLESIRNIFSVFFSCSIFEYKSFRNWNVLAIEICHQAAAEATKSTDECLGKQWTLNMLCTVAKVSREKHTQTVRQTHSHRHIDTHETQI